MVKAQLNWTQDMQFVGQVENGPAIVMDNPQGGSGPTPMQMVIMGVAGCTAMDVTSILKKKRAAVTGIQLNVEGEQAEDHPRKFTAISIEFVITGHQIKPKDVERAIELSATKYCSAIASVNAPVAHKYRIVEPGAA